MDLAIVVTAAAQAPDLRIGHVLDEFLGARIAIEEVLADEGAVVGLVGLEVAVGRRVHEVDQSAVAVGVQQCIPLAAPDHLDDVPSGPAEERLEFLDDLPVAADRSVETLQVAVDDEGQVVECLRRGEAGESP